MNARKHIQDELEALKSSLPAPNKPVFSPPEGYFENFAHSVLMKIKSGKHVTDELNELSPLLAGASKTMPYSVPDDFFSGISSQLDTITREEIQPSFSKVVGKKMPYQVPDGYFEKLSGQILRRTKGGKVISMPGTRWMRIAAAAVFAGMIALAGIFYFSQPSIDPAATDAWVTKKLNGISNQELDAFLRNAEGTSNDMVNSSQTAEVRTMLHDVSDRELDVFLSQLPTEEDETLLIN